MNNTYQATDPGIKQYVKTGTHHTVQDICMAPKTQMMKVVVEILRCGCTSCYLVLRVVNHGCLPFTINIVIPVLGLLGVRVGNVFGLVVVLKDRKAK